MSEFEKYAIIVSGGTGNRMESKLPKQFLELKGLPILMHSISAFHKNADAIKIILVLSELHLKIWEDLCIKHNFIVPHSIVFGGKSRFHSVKYGLNFIFNHITTNKSLTQTSPFDKVLIAIHDGVRPLVGQDLINRAYIQAEKEGTAVPAIKSKDSLRIIESQGRTKAINRDSVLLIQTPQIFRAQLLKEAYKQEFNETFTDDASVIEKSGYPINIIEGDIRNIKITYPIDLAIAGIHGTIN